ncbi:hypothetical protein Tco_0180074 [Tanacetum coccineum]
METTLPQKKETVQVVIDVIKNSSCLKAFTISTEVPEIFMQQFWHSIKKVKGTNSYEFNLANKKCVVDAEVFRKILNICPRVQGEDFTKVPDDETTLTFLINLGYKGPLYKHPSMLRKSRIEILWRMFYKENVDYLELIWEDFAFQIDHRMEKQRRHENMPYHSRGKGSQGNKEAVSLKPTSDEEFDESDAKPARKRTGSRRVIKKKVSIFADDNIIPEPDVALELGKSLSLTKAAEEEAARQVHATHERIVIKSDPEPPRRRPSGIAFRDTSSVSKKMSLDLSQKLKGIQTLTPEEKLTADTMQILKSSRKSIRSQPHAGGSCKGTGTKPGVLDESTVTPTTSSEGTEEESEYTKEDYDDENIKWVDTDEEEKKNDDDDDKSINLEKTDDEETDDEFVHSEEYVQDDDEETDDESVHGDAQVNDDEDEKMANAEDADTGNGDEESIDAAKADAEKAKEVKDDIKKAELPSLGSSLPVSLGFVVTPIPKTPLVAPATTLLPPISVLSISHVLLQTTTPIPTPPIITETPPITMIPDPLHAIIQRVYVLEKDVQELKEVDNNTILRASLRSEIPSTVNAYLRSSMGDALQKVLQKHTEELKQHYSHKIDYKEIIKESVQANFINEVKNQLPKFLPNAVSNFATLVIQSTIKNALEKTPLLIDKSHSYLTHDKHQTLFDALLNSMSRDDAIVRGQADREKVMRKRGCDDEDPLTGPNQGKKTKRSRNKESEPSKKSSTSKESSKGKSPAKTSKYGKSVTAEEPVEELVVEMAFDDIEQTIDDVANDDNQPPDDSTQTKDKAPKTGWFKQPRKPPTPDPEWNKRQVVDDQPEQP